jgi:putative transposase
MRLQVTDLFFRSLFAFFIIDLHSRRVIHVGVTRSPTDAWTAQQLWEATAYGRGPKYLFRDRGNRFGSCFARVAATRGIKILKKPYQTPRANAICERFLGNVRRECLDHLLILQEKHLDRVLHAYGEYFNRARPHQGIRQQIPEWYGESVPLDHQRGKILALPVLGGLHHEYCEIRLTTETCADKRMFPYGGICLIWEVTDLQVLSSSFSDDDDKQCFCVFPGKALHT